MNEKVPFISGTAINYTANIEVSLFLNNCAVIQFALRLPLFWLSEGGLREHHVVVLSDLHSMTPTELSCK